jgi:hypothetical protein
MSEQISVAQNKAEEKMCQWVKELALMGVSRETICNQVNATLDELQDQLKM